MNDVEKEVHALIEAQVARDLTGGHPTAGERLIVRSHHVLTTVGHALANDKACTSPEVRAAIVKWVRIARQLMITEVAESDRVLAWYRLGYTSDFETMDSLRALGGAAVSRPNEADTSSQGSPRSVHDGQ